MKKLLCIIMSACLLLCVACKDTSGVNKPSDNDKIVENTDVTLYFSDRQGLALVGEMREVPKDENIAENTLKMLIEGPLSDELVNIIPKGTKLNSLEIKDSVCTVDLSGEFVNGAYGSSSSDTLCVYSIVNTLTSLDSVDEVLFLIDGEEVEIFGDFIFNEPFAADESLIKK